MTQPNQRDDPSRRRFLKTTGQVAGTLALGVTATGSAAANPGKPSFTEQIYADGRAWGTKGATTLNPPNDHNRQSFDPLVFIVDSNDVIQQPPVSEAGPGNPDYNGGRWISQRAYVVDGGPAEILTSYEDVLAAVDDGTLMAPVDGAPHPNGGPAFRPDYFECPLLPVKD